MHTLEKTVVLHERGAQKFGDGILRVGRLAGFLSGISLGIMGRSTRRRNRIWKISLQHLVLISSTAVIAVIRIRREAKPDQLQLVLLQTNLLTEKLYWKHLITFDGIGAIEILGKYSVDDYELVCFPSWQEVENFSSAQAIFQLRWVKTRLQKNSPGPRVFTITERKVQVTWEDNFSWDGVTFPVYDAELVE